MCIARKLSSKGKPEFKCGIWWGFVSKLTVNLAVGREFELVICLFQLLDSVEGRSVSNNLEAEDNINIRIW